MDKTITHEEIEKAAETYADRLAELRPTIFPDISEAFKDGANFALGKQEKDATMQQDYKSGELECWCDFCNTEIARRNSFDRALVKAANNFAFFRGYRFGKQEKDADTVIQGWVARDESGDLYMYICKPKKISNLGYWDGDVVDVAPSNNLFPDLTWSDNPIEVEIIIKRKKNG